MEEIWVNESFVFEQVIVIAKDETSTDEIYIMNKH